VDPSGVVDDDVGLERFAVDLDLVPGADEDVMTVVGGGAHGDEVPSAAVGEGAGVVGVGGVRGDCGHHLLGLGGGGEVGLVDHVITPVGRPERRIPLPPRPTPGPRAGEGPGRQEPQGGHPACRALPAPRANVALRAVTLTS